MKKLLTISAALSALLASGVYAQTVDQVKYFTIDENSVMITEMTDKGGTIPSTAELPKPPSGPVINPPVTTPTSGPDLNGTITTIDSIVNLAQKIWDIVQANCPVVNITVNYANAVPFGTSHWTQLQSWSKPATKKYTFSMKNALGGQVVKVDYQVDYTYGGNFQGKGKFLTGVAIEPINVTAIWGYKVDLTAEVPDSTVANVGTSEDPIASMQVKLKWKVHTALKDITEQAIYYVQGDGLLNVIGTPVANGMGIQSREKAQELQTKIENSRFY